MFLRIILFVNLKWYVIRCNFLFFELIKFFFVF